MTTDVSACHFCQAQLPSFGYINGCHWTGTEYVRVDACTDCHSAKRMAKAPRKPRRPRQAPQYAATDWNMLVAFTKGANR